MVTGESPPRMTQIGSGMKITHVKEWINFMDFYIILLIVYLNFWFRMQLHIFQAFSVTSFFYPDLLTSRNCHWHWYLTWWHPVNEILDIKQPLRTAVPSKVVHNFYQGPREGILEQPGGKKEKTQTKCIIYCLMFLSDDTSFLWLLEFLSNVSSMIY